MSTRKPESYSEYKARRQEIRQQIDFHTQQASYHNAQADASRQLLEELEQTYGQDDWFGLVPDPEGILDVDGICVPYVTMSNEPESTDGEVLDERYHKACDCLYALWSKNRAKMKGKFNKTHPSA